MRVLVTGANGFVGFHLLKELEAHGHESVAMTDPGDPTNPLSVDITDAAELADLVERTAPDACIHLAGMAFVPLCEKKPRLAFDVNTTGTLNLLEAFRQHAPKARLLVIATSEVYGRQAFNGPVTEDTPLNPTSLYGITKVAADELTRHYAKMHGLHAMVARPENHIGPGQRGPFVASSFAQQIAKALQAGQSKAHLKTGNLDSQRDFTDVRDTVVAYRLLVEKGLAGRAYNVASGQLARIGDLLENLAKAAGIPVTSEIEPTFFRPTDCSPVFSTERLQADTGWTPKIPLQQTVADMLDELRHAASTGQV